MHGSQWTYLRVLLCFSKDQRAPLLFDWTPMTQMNSLSPSMCAQSPFFENLSFFFSLPIKTTNLCLFIAIDSRSTWEVFLSSNPMSHPPEKSFLNFKKSIHAFHVRSLIFSKNFFIPILTLWKSSFPFQVLPISKFFFLRLVDFPIKTSNY